MCNTKCDRVLTIFVNTANTCMHINSTSIFKTSLKLNVNTRMSDHTNLFTSYYIGILFSDNSTNHLQFVLEKVFPEPRPINTPICVLLD